MLPFSENATTPGRLQYVHCSFLKISRNTGNEGEQKNLRFTLHTQTVHCDNADL